MDRQGSCGVTDPQRCSEAAILSLLLSSGGCCIWSVEELMRELSSPKIQVLDALSSLEGAGLTHKAGPFIFPTRAAWCFDRLDM